VRRLMLMLFISILTIPTFAQTSEEEAPFIFGMVLVGPRDDQGWSQAHFEAGRYVEIRHNAQMLLHENHALTAAEQPMSEVVERFIEQGAKLIILSSSSFQQDAEEIAPLHPDIMFLHIAGDSVLTGTAPANLGNLMAQMEWAKFLDGCAAALVTETGNIGYLGPLVNTETRRLAASTYLGARHCYDTYREDATNELTFRVEWIGFWYNIDQVTQNPTTITYNMYESGIDVVISGIDTQEALTVARRFHQQDRRVFALSYNSEEACERYEDVCLGTAYFEWGPTYAEIVRAVREGNWVPGWEWRKPTSLYTTPSIVRFEIGGAFDTTLNADLERFRAELNVYNNNDLVPSSLPLWQGPLQLQDGTLLAEEGELVNILDVWYLPQLLQGMEGSSADFNALAQ
jgi:simple sugar transport system substrate-binding protein